MAEPLPSSVLDLAVAVGVGGIVLSVRAAFGSVSFCAMLAVSPTTAH